MDSVQNVSCGSRIAVDFQLRIDIDLKRHKRLDEGLRGGGVDNRAVDQGSPFVDSTILLPPRSITLDP
jgi:hypothetical protein